MTHPRLRDIAMASAVLAGLASLSACAPLLIGGAVFGGSMVAVDRRTSGAQLEDEAIELKAPKRISDAIGDRGSVSVTSYNRIVLLTGTVPTDADKGAVEQGVARIENVKSVVNELATGATISLGTRSNDALLTSKVKASLIDAKDIQVNSVKVVTERGIVYLMGRVTEREANRTAEIARGVGGVQKVVKVFEVVSEAELADLPAKPAEPAKP